MKRLFTLTAFALTIACGSLAAVPVEARARAGSLRADVYNYPDVDFAGDIQPWRGELGTLCGRTTVEDINFAWGGGSVAGCQSDDVAIHFTGFISVPRAGTYTFYTSSDDGVRMIVNRRLVIYNWVDQGDFLFNALGVIRLRGKAKLDLWYYENGGGAAMKLYYSTSRSGPTLVPSSWFSIR